MGCMSKSSRNLNIDILRVIIMFFILLEHLMVNSIFHDNYLSSQILDANTNISLLNFLGFELVETLCSVSVNCFIFITGYFYITKDNSKILKIEETWLHVFFYSFGIAVSCYILGRLYSETDYKFTDVIKSMLVIRSPHYWFVPQYLGLLLLSPFLSHLVQGFSKIQYLSLLCSIGLLSLSFWGIPFGNTFGAKDGAGLIWFVFLYYTAGYLRLYRPFEKSQNSLLYFFVLLIVSWFLLSFNGLFSFFCNNKIVYSFYHISLGTNGIVFLLSLIFFQLILTSKFCGNLWNQIVRISPYVFSVYLISSHRGLKYYLYDRFNLVSAYFDSLLFFPILILETIFVFILCVVVDTLRERIFLLLQTKQVFDMLNKKIQHFIDKL